MREETKIKIQLARIIQNKMSSSYKRIVEFYLDDIQVIDWLIEQAEKVEQLETDKEFFKKEYMQINEKYLKVLEQLQQAQAKVVELQDKLERCEAGYHYFNKTCDYWRGKAKRYEIALKDIAKDSLTMSDNFYNKYYELREIARLALEGEVK